MQGPITRIPSRENIMQVAYFDCFSGISGDMTLAALIDAGAELTAIQTAIDSMSLGSVRLSVSNTQRKGFRGKLLAIEQPREHAHRYLRDVHSLIRRGRFSADAKDLAMRFFERLARAEARVHGTTIDRVQFHEVGAIDSIVDLVGVAIAWTMLGIDKAYASPVPTGTGLIRIAHGTVSVPAPATAELLIGVPIAPTQIAMEMTTPTGAAILTELATEFGPMPAMQVGRIGYGAGNKDVPDRPNLLRVLIGNSIESRKQETGDQVLVIECNLDDVTGEQIGFAIACLWQAGALDVFTTAIQMKKNRPGTILTVLCQVEDRHRMEAILFRQTGTLGVRYRKQSRTVLARALVHVSTEWGMVQGKVSKLPTGEVDFSPEHDTCSRIANQHGLRLSDVVAKVIERYAFEERKTSVSIVSPIEAVIPVLPTAGSIENVNTVFMQAAFEDELGEQEPIIDSPNRQPDLFSLQEERGIDESESNAFYRWDSSPWTAEPMVPHPRSEPSVEFPLVDDQ
jgi:pyridinium-3,5-bisthiocarboxylic acid mononucleotide nickel chelatase